VQQTLNFAHGDARLRVLEKQMRNKHASSQKKQRKEISLRLQKMYIVQNLDIDESANF